MLLNKTQKEEKECKILLEFHEYARMQAKSRAAEGRSSDNEYMRMSEDTRYVKMCAINKSLESSKQ